MLNWAYFPRSARPTALALQVVQAFEVVHEHIDSATHKLPSNGVLAHVGPNLLSLGFVVESGKKQLEKVSVPVLYGNNGHVDKAFEADAHHVEGRFVVEVEAGRGVANNQFLKDLFQACMMDQVEYLAIAVRTVYKAGTIKSKDFEIVVRHFDTLYNSDRMRFPLKGILILGY